MTAQRLGNLRVDDEHPVPVGLVDELRLGIAAAGHEAMLGREIGDLDVVGGTAHSGASGALWSRAHLMGLGRTP